MNPSNTGVDVDASAVAHARLLDEFIEVTKVELDTVTCEFTRESLRDLLENLRAERRGYGPLPEPASGGPLAS